MQHWKDVDQVGVFRWMLSAAYAEAFDNLTHKVLENIGIAGLQVVARDAADPSAGFTSVRKGKPQAKKTAASKKKQAASDDDAEFMRLFD